MSAGMETTTEARAGRELAGWGYRVGGGAIDICLALVPASLIDASGDGAGTARTAGAVTLYAIWILNVGVLAGLTNGRSVGKLVAGTRAVRESGKRFGIGMGILRDVVLRFAYVIPVVLLVDALLPLAENRKSLRDRIVKTRVVKETAAGPRARLLTAAAVGATAVMVLVFVATGAFDSEYSASDKEDFVEACREEGSSRAGCACAFENIKAELSYDEYYRIDRQDPEDWSPRVRRVIDQSFERCPR